MNLRTRMLTGRDALVACASCANEKTRALYNVADQWEGVGNTSLLPNAALVVFPEQLPGLEKIITRPVPVQVPSGRGVPVPGILGVATLLISVSANHWLQAETFPQTWPAMLRTITDALRTKTRDCCQRAVEKRVRRQDSPYTKKPHKHARRRT